MDNENNYMNNASFMTKLSNKLYSFVPNDYKYKFNSLGNSLSYITTGKNQYDMFLEPRMEIKTGRNDDIFHIIKNNDENLTYCLLQPTDINIKFPENYYNNIDYYNINEKLLDEIKYPTSMTIPFTTSNIKNTGILKYGLNIDNQRYLNIANRDVSNKIDKNKNLFKLNKNNIILNSFPNNNYNSTADIIAIYAPILLNKNYKGQIMTIIVKNNIENKYRNIYYDKEYNSLYYKDDLNVPINLNFDKDYYDIHRLFDQTGNGHDYIFDNGNDMDDKYPPMLIKRDENYSIEFFSRSILYLSKKYPNIKSSINASIQFNALNKYQKGIQFKGNKRMSILTNGNEPIMYIDIDNIHSNKFKFNGNVYDFNSDKTLIITRHEGILNDLYLSSNNGTNMFHGLLYNLILETHTDNNKYIYGVRNYTNKSNVYIMNIYVMGIKFPNSNEVIYLYSILNDDNLYKSDGNVLDLDKIGYANIIELYNQNIMIENDYELYRFRLITDDDRYPPRLVKDKDGKYVIKFFRKSILKLKTQPRNKIIKIEANIEIESINCNPDNIIESYQCKYATEFDDINGYMDLLASKKSSIIKLEFNNDNKYKDDLKYRIKNEIEGKKTEEIYVPKNKEKINIDLDNPSLIECLGVAHDIRTNDDFHLHRLDEHGGRGNVNKKSDYIKQHAFIGFLDKLVISKRK